jgi:hypothetical protein
MEALIVLTAFILLAVLAPFLGVDSRHLDAGFRD